MAEPAPLIEVLDLRKTYLSGELRVDALRGVSLAIRPGEFLAVMGASGSGKSTLMNILGLLDRPTGGVYRLEGRDAGTLPREELARIRSRRIGFVFQNFSLLPRFTAFENVELPMIYDAVSRAERIRRTRAALEAVGILARAAHLPRQMSGGEQQRAAIARAIVNTPALLLADEPTGNLDTATSAEILAIFRSLNQERGITVVLVTHDPEVARSARRIVRFRDGRILSDEAAVPPAGPGTPLP